MNANDTTALQKTPPLIDPVLLAPIQQSDLDKVNEAVTAVSNSVTTLVLLLDDLRTNKDWTSWGDGYKNTRQGWRQFLKDNTEFRLANFERKLLAAKNAVEVAGVTSEDVVEQRIEADVTQLFDAVASANIETQRQYAELPTESRQEVGQAVRQGMPFEEAVPHVEKKSKAQICYDNIVSQDLPHVHQLCVDGEITFDEAVNIGWAYRDAENGTTRAIVRAFGVRSRDVLVKIDNLPADERESIVSSKGHVALESGKTVHVIDLTPKDLSDHVRRVISEQIGSFQAAFDLPDSFVSEGIGEAGDRIRHGEHGDMTYIPTADNLNMEAACIQHLVRIMQNNPSAKVLGVVVGINTHEGFMMPDGSMVDEREMRQRVKANIGQGLRESFNL